MRARAELEHGEAATRELASRLEKPVGAVSNYVDATPASSGAPAPGSGAASNTWERRSGHRGLGPGRGYGSWSVAREPSADLKPSLSSADCTDCA